jgi:hypothetical protein
VKRKSASKYLYWVPETHHKRQKATTVGYPGLSVHNKETGKYIMIKKGRKK